MKNQSKKRKLPFKENESYMHRDAKANLVNWIKEYPERFNCEDYTSIRLEEGFAEDGNMLFRPDITVYNKDGLKHIYEVCHKSPLTGKRLMKMQHYFYENDMNTVVFEIEAEYIQRQVECPKRLRMQEFRMFNEVLF